MVGRPTPYLQLPPEGHVPLVPPWWVRPCLTWSFDLSCTFRLDNVEKMLDQNVTRRVVCQYCTRFPTFFQLNSSSRKWLLLQISPAFLGSTALKKKPNKVRVEISFFPANKMLHFKEEIPFMSAGFCPKRAEGSFLTERGGGAEVRGCYGHHFGASSVLPKLLDFPLQIDRGCLQHQSSISDCQPD